MRLFPGGGGSSTWPWGGVSVGRQVDFNAMKHIFEVDHLRFLNISFPWECSLPWHCTVPIEHISTLPWPSSSFVTRVGEIRFATHKLAGKWVVFSLDEKGYSSYTPCHKTKRWPLDPENQRLEDDISWRGWLLSAGFELMNFSEKV